MFRHKNKIKRDQINLPDEVLLHIFSFFDRPQPSTLSVSKQWNNVGNDEDLWRSYIKSEFLERIDQSKLSAKEFYMKNRDARKSKEQVYCLTSPLIYCSDGWGNPNPQACLIDNISKFVEIDLSQKQLNSIFLYCNGNYLPAFSELKDAIVCADTIYKLLSCPIGMKSSFEPRYPVIFHAECNTAAKLKMTHEKYSPPWHLRSINVENTHHFYCYKIKISELSKPYAAYTKNHHHLRLHGDAKIHTSSLIVQAPEPSKTCTIS